MTIQATWNGNQYLIPEEYSNILICESLHKQTPQIVTKGGDNLFMSCNKEIYTKDGYKRIIEVTHNATDYSALTRNSNLYTMKVTIPIGDIRERQKAVVMAAIKFVNRIHKNEGNTNDNTG